MAVLDACGLCSLIRGVIKIDELLPMLEAATGAGYDKESLLLTGERIWNLERLFNLEAGLAKRDDSLPKRMLEEPMPEGPAKGQVAQLDLMLPEYYQVRGWNADGVPTQDKLIELGLETTTNKEE